MYAIVDIAGQQMKVQKNGKLFVNRLKGEVGSEVEFNKVLLIENDGKVIIGNPVIEGAVVSARILDHLKGDKVLIFKKKRRKGYKVLKGHRQYLTQIEIEDILESGKHKKTTRKEKAVTAEEAVTPSETEAVAQPSAEETTAPAKASRKTSRTKAQSIEEGESHATAKPKVKKASKKSDEEKSNEKDE